MRITRHEHLGSLECIQDALENFSIDDGDGSENVTLKTFVAFIPIRWNVKCRPISLELISWEPDSNFRKRKKNSSSLVYVLHKAWNQAFSHKCSDGKEMYKKAWCTCEVVLRNKPIAFLSFSLPSPLLKLPNCSRLLLAQLLRLFRATNFRRASYHS